MTRDVFNRLFVEALAEPDEERFIAEWSSSSLLFDPEQDNVDFDEILRVLHNAWSIAHLPPRDFVTYSGLGQAAFARRYCIKQRTLEHWISGQNAMPPHTRYMIAELLGLIQF